MTSLIYDLSRVRRIQIDRVLLAVILVLAVLTLADPGFVPEAVGSTVTALVSTAPLILLAVLCIGYLKATGAEVLAARAFMGRDGQMIVLASLVGGLAPFCSCEVIPFVAGLLAVGAPVSAVMAFWLSSPLIDPASLLITAGALGWPFAIAKMIAAVALGLLGGFVTKAILDLGYLQNPLRPQPRVGCGCGAPKLQDGKPVWRFWTQTERTFVFRRESTTNALFLLKWLTLAYLLETLMVAYIPAQMIASIVGGQGFFPIAISALVGIPAYLNSYAAPALVSGLMAQGMTHGAAMAFMIGGAVSSIPAMTAVFALVRPQVVAAYLCLGLGGAILSGLAYGAISNW